MFSYEENLGLLIINHQLQTVWSRQCHMTYVVNYHIIILYSELEMFKSLILSGYYKFKSPKYLWFIIIYKELEEQILTLKKTVTIQYWGIKNERP